MTDVRDDFDEFMKNPEADLIIDFLSGDLDRERMLEVRRRLDDDPVFKDLATPIIYAWSVPRYATRRPMSRAQYDRLRDDFARRAGLGGLRITRERRRWNWRRIGRYGAIVLAAFAVLGALGAVVYRSNRDAIAEWKFVRGMQPVADTAGHVVLADGSRILLAPGARLRVHRSVTVGAAQRYVYLEGSARVTVAPRDTATFVRRPPVDFLVVATSGGWVVAHRADFQVTAHGKTTTVSVYSTYPDCVRRDRYAIDCTTFLKPSVSLLRPNAKESDSSGAVISLQQGQTGRIARGHNPEKGGTP
jgi:hypothetical protein